jgi:glucose-6-phosphate 1-dehydrogenase
VQINMPEAFDVADRGAFYDQAGAIRDVVQNHLLQVVSLLAMEAPSGRTPEAVRNEQFKVLDSIRPLAPDDVVRGQYRGYREVAGVAPDSGVETFAAVRLYVDTWRWSGVPFYVRTGKCLPVTATEVRVIMRRPPQAVFGEAEPRDADYFRFRLSPDMSISLGTRAKKPGEAMVGEAVELYASHQSGTERPPYQRLIGDAVRGDQSLFAREDSVEAAWRVVDGVLDVAAHPYAYEPGTWGPPEAASVLLRGDRWHDPAATPNVPEGDPAARRGAPSVR